jgi:hypothetical protein
MNKEDYYESRVNFGYFRKIHNNIQLVGLISRICCINSYNLMSTSTITD